MITNEQDLKLLEVLEERKKNAIGLAQMKACEYVTSAAEVDRAAAKSYQHDAELWQEAWAIVNAARGGRL